MYVGTTPSTPTVAWYIQDTASEVAGQGQGNLLDLDLDELNIDQTNQAAAATQIRDVLHGETQDGKLVCLGLIRDSGKLDLYFCPTIVTAEQTQYQNEFVAFMGELDMGQNFDYVFPKIETEGGPFQIIPNSVYCVKPDTVMAEAQKHTDDSTPFAVGPYTLGDADVTLVSTRKVFKVPFSLIGQFLAIPVGADVAKYFWAVIYPVIKAAGNGKIKECKSLIDYFLIAVTIREEGEVMQQVRLSEVQLPRPVERDIVLKHYRLRELGRLFPKLFPVPVDVPAMDGAEVLDDHHYGQNNDHNRHQTESISTQRTRRMSVDLGVQGTLYLSYKNDITQKNMSTPKLGILRLDYNYPPAVGDIDNAESFDYPVIYRVIPGLTFEMCQSGELPDNVKAECLRAVKYLEQQGVSGITGDCGFMINIQDLISDATNKPVFTTSLVQLPSLCMCFDSDETIAVFTANSNTLLPILPRMLEMCALRQEDKDRIQIVGCQDVDGFDAVEKGEAVDVVKVDAGIVALAKSVIAANPRIKAILLECTELPAYADSLKLETGLPVYDSISVCNSFMAGFLDNPRIGLNDFHEAWDGTQAEYSFGACLSRASQAKVVSRISSLFPLSTFEEIDDIDIDTDDEE